MRCHISISRQALRHNLEVFSRNGSLKHAMPVIKSNAYGHGFQEVLGELEQISELRWIGVNYLSEAITARNLGWQRKILVVGPVSSKRFCEAAKQNIDIIVGDLPSLSSWKRLDTAERPNIHIKIDTGMSRQGFQLEQISSALKLLEGEQSSVKGISTHFANVEDVTEQSFAEKQQEKFAKAVKALENIGINCPKHLAASAASLLIPESKADLDRIGISLYGLWPSQATKISCNARNPKQIKLEPVLSWQTEIALVKDINTGDFVGYGCTYQAQTAMKIAILPIGYYEGYPRLAGSRGAHVLVRGQRCPIVGRICMNMMMIDVSNIKDVKEEDVVTLIGKEGSESVTAEDLASWAETINYEIVTCLNPNIPRIVK